MEPTITHPRSGGTRATARHIRACLCTAIAVIALAGAPVAAAAQGTEIELVGVPGGDFVMGDAGGEPDETPRAVTVAPFRLMRFEVTNRQFTAFIKATGHETDARRTGFGYVWDGRWRQAAGADWRHPRGPGGGIGAKADHPVVQVSATDAAAFCAWHGLRLPAEEEWEFAARGPAARRYPWGDARPEQRGTRRANFGTERCCAPDPSDGFALTAPVGSFPAGASPFGIEDMAGNVWEWTASAFPGRPAMVALRGGGWGNDAYCLRGAYRHANPPDIGLEMVGFRCAGDAKTRGYKRPLPQGAPVKPGQFTATGRR